METLDNLLETIAYESFTTNTYLTELLNGDKVTSGRLINSNNNLNNNMINSHKTDSTLDRYLDNVINYNNINNHISNNNVSRKSDESEGSSSSDHNGKMPLLHHQVNEIMHHYHNSLPMPSLTSISRNSLLYTIIFSIIYFPKIISCYLFEEKKSACCMCLA
jgi:hypothetical protein